MPSPPSLDLSRVRIPLGSAPSPTELESCTTKELKDELLRRGNVDFSKWELAVKLSPFALLFCAVLIYKLSVLWDGTLWGCLLQ
jgi:hypothetical protein